MTRTRSLYSALVVLVTAVSMPSVAWPQAVPAAQKGSGTLVVAGDVKTPLTLTLDELKSLPRTTAGVPGEGGRTTSYQGVLVSELLKRAGAPPGNEMMSGAVSTYVVLIAGDGYRAVFSLAELDPAFADSRALVADTVDGKPLPGPHGPLRLIVPQDKRPSRSVRMLERIEVHRLPK